VPVTVSRGLLLNCRLAVVADCALAQLKGKVKAASSTMRDLIFVFILCAFSLGFLGFLQGWFLLFGVSTQFYKLLSSFFLGFLLFFLGG
jgi:hypothetical protein